MATLHADHIDLSPNSERDSEGWLRLERAMMVTGVTGQGYKMHLNALKVSGMPQLGDEHPAIADMEVVRYRFASPGKQVVEVYPIYERVDAADDPDAVHVSGSAYTIDVETNRDSAGNLIVVTFAGKKQSGTIMVPASGFRWTIRKRTSFEPDELSMEYVGTYNSGAWSLGGQSVTPATAGTWKCAAYDYDSSDNEETWDSIIVIERAPMMPDGTTTWAQEVFYIDPETGRIPDAVANDPVTYSSAFQTVAAGPLTDFTGLVS